MRPVDGHKNFGMTRTVFSNFGHGHFRTEKHFFRFLLCRRFFFGFDKPVFAIANLAHLHLRSLAADTLAKAKELNCLPANNGVLRTLMRISLRSVKGASHRRMAFLNS